MAAEVPSGTHRRWLRPGAPVPVGDDLWVLDDLHPVAAAIDARTGEVLDLVGWSESSSGAESHSRRVCAAGDGIWVQQPEGPVLLVRRGVPSRGYFADGRMLATSSAHGAWCADRRRAAGRAARIDEDHRPDRSPLRLLDPEDRSRTVWIEGDVRSLRPHDGDLFLEVVDWEAIGPRRALDPDADPERVPSHWLRLPADEPAPERLGHARHRCDETSVPPPPPRRRISPWLGTPSEPEGVTWPGLVPQARVDGLDWHVGREHEPRVVPRRLAAHGVGPDGHVIRRVPLGTGDVLGVAATGGGLWVTVRPPRVGPSLGREVPLTLLRVDVEDGSVSTALRSDEIEISDHAWPLDPRPAEADDYVAHHLECLADLQRYWRRPDDGRLLPLAEGMSDCRTELVGTWPDTRLEITFAWDRRPGLRLRRSIALFDELGRIANPEHAGVDLMEDLDTDNVPPASAAVADVLDL